MIIEAVNTQAWKQHLSAFERVDVCHLPEYHSAYQRHFTDAKALMWCFRENDNLLCYPFLLSPVILLASDGSIEETEYFDVSGIYGYSGPLSTSSDQGFLDKAWSAFEEWTLRENVISEFIRFSSYVENHKIAHPEMLVEPNRPVAIAILPAEPDQYLSQLGSKTRNMIRKALKAGYETRCTSLKTELDQFRDLYSETMERNQAPDFFYYDDAYYTQLMALPENELRLFSVFSGNEMVAAAVGLIHRDMAFYHLGASKIEASRQGAGNLALFAMAKYLIEQKVTYFCVGGGRTTSDDDPLFRFKKSNATSVKDFYIGKRVIQPTAYASIVKKWETMNDTKMTHSNLQFYR